MADTIPDDTMQELADYLQGSSNTLSQAMTTFDIDEGVDEGELECRLLDYDTEICVVCGWWCEVGELEYREEDGGGVCDDCGDP